MNQFRASLRTPPANMAAHPTQVAPGAKRPVPANTTRNKSVPSSQETTRAPMTASTVTTAPTSTSQGTIARKKTTARPEDVAAPRKEDSIPVKTMTSTSSTKGSAAPIIRKTTPVRSGNDSGGTIKVTRPTTPLPTSRPTESKIPATTVTTPRASRLPLRATPSKTSTSSRTSTGTVDSPPRTVRVMTMKPVPMKAKMSKTPPPTSPTPLSEATSPPPTSRPPTILVKPKIRVGATSSTSAQSARTMRDSSNISIPASMISGTLVPPGTISKKRSSGLREPLTKGGKVFECEEADGPCSRESCAAIPSKPKYDMKYAKSPTPESKESVMSAPPVNNRNTLGKTNSKTIILELELPNKATSIATVGNKKGSSGVISKVVNTVSSPTASPLGSPTNIREAANGASSSSLPTKKRLSTNASEYTADQKKSSSSEQESTAVLSKKDSISDDLMMKSKNQTQTIHHLTEKMKTHPPKSAPTSKERATPEKLMMADKLLEQTIKTQRTSLSQDQLMLKQQQQLKMQQQLYHETQSLIKPKILPMADKRPTKRSSSRIAVEQKIKIISKEENKHTKRSSLSLVDEPGLKIQSKQSSLTINDEGKQKMSGKKLQSTTAPTKPPTAPKVISKTATMVKKTLVKDKVKGESISDTKNKIEKEAEDKDNVRSFVLMVDEPILKEKLKHLAKEDDIGDKKASQENKKLEQERREEILQQKLNFILKEQKRAIEEDSAVDEETLSEVDQAIIASLETFGEGEDEERLSIDTQTVDLETSTMSSTINSVGHLERLVALSSGSQINDESDIDVSRVPSIPVSVATQVSCADGGVVVKKPIENERQSLLSYGSQLQEANLRVQIETSDISIGMKSLIDSIETERKSLISYDSEAQDGVSSIGKASNRLFGEFFKDISDLSVADNILIESLHGEQESRLSYDSEEPSFGANEFSDWSIGDKSLGESAINDLLLKKGTGAYSQGNSVIVEDLVDDLTSENASLAGTASVLNASEEKEDESAMLLKTKDSIEVLLSNRKEELTDGDPTVGHASKLTTFLAENSKMEAATDLRLIDSKLSAKSMPPTIGEDVAPATKVSAKSLQAKLSALSARLLSPTAQLKTSLSSTRYISPNFSAHAVPPQSASSTRALSPDGMHEKSSLPPLSEAEAMPTPTTNTPLRLKSPRTISPTINVKMSKSSIRSISPTTSMHGKMSPTLLRPLSPSASLRPVSPVDSKGLTMRATSPSLRNKMSAHAVSPNISARITSPTLTKPISVTSAPISESTAKTSTPAYMPPSPPPSDLALTTTKDIGTSPSPTMIRDFFKDGEKVADKDSGLLADEISEINAPPIFQTPNRAEFANSWQSDDSPEPVLLITKSANVSASPLAKKENKLARTSQSTTDIESLTSMQSFLDKQSLPSDQFMMGTNTSDSSFGDDQAVPLLLSAIAKDTISSPLIRRGRSEQPLDQGDLTDSCLATRTTTFGSSGTTVLSFAKQSHAMDKELDKLISESKDKIYQKFSPMAKVDHDLKDIQSSITKNDDNQGVSTLLRKKSMVCDASYAEKAGVVQKVASSSSRKLLPFQNQDILPKKITNTSVNISQLTPDLSFNESSESESGSTKTQIPLEEKSSLLSPTDSVDQPSTDAAAPLTDTANGEPADGQENASPAVVFNPSKERLLAQQKKKVPFPIRDPQIMCLETGATWIPPGVFDDNIVSTYFKMAQYEKQQREKKLLDNRDANSLAIQLSLLQDSESLASDTESRLSQTSLTSPGFTRQRAESQCIFDEDSNSLSTGSSGRTNKSTDSPISEYGNKLFSKRAGSVSPDREELRTDDKDILEVPEGPLSPDSEVVMSIMMPSASFIQKRGILQTQPSISKNKDKVFIDLSSGSQPMNETFPGMEFTEDSLSILSNLVPPNWQDTISATCMDGKGHIQRENVPCEEPSVRPKVLNIRMSPSEDIQPTGKLSPSLQSQFQAAKNIEQQGDVFNISQKIPSSAASVGSEWSLQSEASRTGVQKDNFSISTFSMTDKKYGFEVSSELTRKVCSATPVSEVSVGIEIKTMASSTYSLPEKAAFQKDGTSISTVSTGNVTLTEPTKISDSFLGKTLDEISKVDKEIKKGFAAQVGDVGQVQTATSTSSMSDSTSSTLTAVSTPSKKPTVNANKAFDIVEISSLSDATLSDNSAAAKLSICSLKFGEGPSDDSTTDNLHKVPSSVCGLTEESSDKSIRDKLPNRTSTNLSSISKCTGEILSDLSDATITSKLTFGSFSGEKTDLQATKEPIAFETDNTPLPFLAMRSQECLLLATKANDDSSSNKTLSSKEKPESQFKEFHKLNKESKCTAKPPKMLQISLDPLGLDEVSVALSEDYSMSVVSTPTVPVPLEINESETVTSVPSPIVPSDDVHFITVARIPSPPPSPTDSFSRLTLSAMSRPSKDNLAPASRVISPTAVRPSEGTHSLLVSVASSLPSSVQTNRAPTPPSSVQTNRAPTPPSSVQTNRAPTPPSARPSEVTDFIVASRSPTTVIIKSESRITSPPTRPYEDNIRAFRVLSPPTLRASEDANFISLSRLYSPPTRGPSEDVGFVESALTPRKSKEEALQFNLKRSLANQTIDWSSAKDASSFLKTIFNPSEGSICGLNKWMPTLSKPIEDSINDALLRLPSPPSSNPSDELTHETLLRVLSPPTVRPSEEKVANTDLKIPLLTPGYSDEISSSLISAPSSVSSSRLTSNLTKLSDDTAFFKVSRLPSPVSAQSSENASAYDSMTSKLSDESAMGKSSMKTSPITERPHEDTLRRVSRSPSPLITKLPENSVNLQDNSFDNAKKFKLDSEPSQINASNQKSSTRMSVDGVNKKQPGSLSFSKLVDEVTNIHLQRTPSPPTARPSEETTTSKRPSRGPSPIIVRVTEYETNIHGMPPAEFAKDTGTSTSNLSPWSVGIENANVEQGGMAQQLFGSSKMIPSIVTELLPSKLGVKAFGSRSQLLETKPVLTLQEDLTELPKRDEILKIFAVALSVGKLTPELKEILTAISKRAACEKKSPNVHSDFLSVPLSSTHDMLPQQKPKSLQQQQQEVLSKLSMALDLGKLSKELHSSLSELCAGEKTQIEQEALHALSGLLSPVSAMSSNTHSSAMGTKSTENTNTTNTLTSSSTANSDARELKSIATFDELNHITDSISPVNAPLRSNSPVEVISLNENQQLIKRPSIGLQMPTPTVSQYSTDVSFLDEFAASAVLNASIGGMPIENPRGTVGKPPKPSTTSMKDDLSSKRKKIKPSSLSLGEEPLQNHMKPTSWSVGEILFRQQPSIDVNERDLKTAMFARDVSKTFFKEDTSSEDIMAMYGGMGPKNAVLERKSSSGDERPASNVTLGKIGDEMVISAESSIKINPVNDIAPHFGEILNDASFLSQLVTSLEKQQRKENTAANMISEDPENTIIEPPTDSPYNKTTNLMAAIDSVTLKPFQRWKSNDGETIMESGLLSQKGGLIKSSVNRDITSDSEINEDVTSWSRVAAEAVDSLSASNNNWCSRLQKSNIDRQSTSESGFHEGSMIYPAENGEEPQDVSASITPFILDEREWKNDSLNQNANSFAPFYLNMNEPSQSQFPTPFVQQQYVNEGIAMVSNTQGEIIINGQQFSGEQYDSAINEQHQFVIGIPYTHSYANERGRHNENQNQMLGPSGQHFLSESKIVYSPHLGCSVNFPRQGNTNLPVHTSPQSTPTVRPLDRKIPQSTPAVTKLRADAIPFVQSNKTSSALTNPLFTGQYHQGLSSDQAQFGNATTAAYMHQSSGLKIGNLPGQVQYQQGFNNGMFLNGRLDQLSYPYERTYLPDPISYDGMNNMNWQFQLNGNRKINVTDSNEIIPEPVADVPKPDPCSHWSSGETRSQSYDMGQNLDQRNQLTVQQVTPISSTGESVLSDSREDTEIDSSLPVEHFFSLVDVTLTPTFIPSRVTSQLRDESTQNNVANRPITPGPYVSQNESLDSQLDATEIPPPRNEHLFPQLKEAGGTAVSSALTLGKEFTGIGVGSLLKDQRMMQQQEKDMQFNNSKLSIIVSSNGEQDESKLLSSFNVDVVSLPEDVPWSSLVSSEEYSRNNKMSASEQQFMENIKDWSEMDEIERISAEEFYPRQDIMSHERPVSNWSDKLTRISAEDFFQQRLLRQKIDDIQMEGDTIEEIREDNRMSAEDFFQMCSVKHGQWQRPDSNLSERSHLSDRRYPHFNNRFSQLNDQWPPAQFVQNMSNSYVSNHYQEHFYEKNIPERQQFFSKEQNHQMHSYHGGEHFYPKNESPNMDDTNSYTNSMSLTSQSTGHMNQFCPEYYIQQENGQYYNMHGHHNFIHKPEQYSISSPQMTLPHNTSHNLLSEKQGKLFHRGIGGLNVDVDSDKHSRSGGSSGTNSAKFLKMSSNQQMFGAINEMSNFGTSLDQLSSKCSHTGDCFSVDFTNLHLEDGALPSLDLLNKSNRLLENDTKKSKSTSLESRLSVIPEETRQSAEDFYKSKDNKWRFDKAKNFHLENTVEFVSSQKSELFVPITKTLEDNFSTELPSTTHNTAPIVVEENETQTQCVLVVAVPEELVPEGDFELSKRLIEERLARLMEVELATLMAPPRPDSLMVVAESSVVELLNRYRELNSQQSLLEISKSALLSPNTSFTGLRESNDDEAIITVVAAANLQHSAAYRLEKFLESLAQAPIEHFVNMHNTLEGSLSTDLSEYEVVNSTLEGTDMASTPAEMLMSKCTMEEGSQTGDLSNSAAVEVADETSSSQEYLEDIMEESGEYSSLEVSANEQENFDDDMLRHEEMEFGEAEIELKKMSEFGHGDVTTDGDATTNEEDDEDDDDHSLIAVYKGRISPSMLDTTTNSESVSESVRESEMTSGIVSEITADLTSEVLASMDSLTTEEGKPVELDDNERPSEQQLVVPQSNQHLIDRWKNSQSNHVTGFCLVEQPALLTRERISTTIRKRLSEHDLKSTDAKNLMNLLASPMDWPDESPIPKPRRSPKESSGDNRQIPVPSPRKMKLEENVINNIAKSVQIGKITNLQQNVKIANSSFNVQLEKMQNVNKDKRQFRAKPPVLYLRLPKSLMSELPPLPPSPPTSNTTSPNTLSSISRSPNTTPNESPNTSSRSPNASPRSSPRTLKSSMTSPKTPVASPRSPIMSLRSLSSTSTSDSQPTASPRNVFSKQTLGDVSCLKNSECNNVVCPKDDATKCRSPSPLPRRRHMSPMSRSSRSPSPMPRQRLPLNEFEKERVAQSSSLVNRSRSTTPELEKCYLNQNWSPIPLPRHSPKLNDAKTMSSQMTQSEILHDEKNTEVDERIFEVVVSKNCGVTDVQQKPSVETQSETIKKAEEQKQESENESEEEEINISKPEPQESSPFLVAVAASPPPSPPLLPLIATLETIAEVNSQTELPVKRAPVKKIAPLKLTKEHLLSPKFLLELLTPPSMLHAKPPLSPDSKTKQWRVPSPLPLSWLLPQSLPYRQLSIPPLNHLSSLPLTNFEPAVMKSTVQHIPQPIEEWLPPRLTLPSLHKPLTSSLPSVSEATSSDEALSFWHPPSPTPLPEGAVTPAPLAMELHVENVLEKGKVQLTKTELRLPSPLALSSPPPLMPQPTQSKLDSTVKTSPLLHRSNNLRPPSPVKHQEKPKKGIDSLQGANEVDQDRKSPRQFTAEVEEIPLAEVPIDSCEVAVRSRWSPRHQVHTSYSRVNKNTPQRAASPRTVYYQRPTSPAKCQYSLCPAAVSSSYQQLIRPHSPMYHQSRYPPSPNRIIDQWFPAPESQSQVQHQPQFHQYPLSPYPYADHQEQYQAAAHYTVDDLPPIPPVAVAKRVQSPYSLRTPSPCPNSPRLSATRQYSPPRHVPKPATPTRSFHRFPTRPLGRWPTASDVINASSHDVPSHPVTTPMQLRGVNKLYTLVIEDESGAESDESDDAVQTLEDEEVIDHHVINHRIIDHQLIISEPGLSEEEDADAIANALHPEAGYPTYSMYRRYQNASTNCVSPGYDQPISPFHYQSSIAVADSASLPRNSYDMNWIPENMALMNPYHDVRTEMVNSDSDDELIEGQEEDVAMES